MNDISLRSVFIRTKISPLFAEVVPAAHPVVHFHVFGVVARCAVGIKAQQDAVLFGRKRVLQGGFELLDEFGGRHSIGFV